MAEKRKAPSPGATASLANRLFLAPPSRHLVCSLCDVKCVSVLA